MVRSRRRLLKGDKSGGVDYDIKPINSERLLSKVNIFLDLAKQQAQLELKLKTTEVALDVVYEPMFVVKIDDNIIYFKEVAAELAKLFGRNKILGSIDNFFDFQPENTIK